MLFAESAGTCLLCNTPLFIDPATLRRSISIAERAHIVAHSERGPRGDRSVPRDYRAHPANIVLLCPTCHTTVDKDPSAYRSICSWARRRREPRPLRESGACSPSRRDARHEARSKRS
jgi:hypothetical protein